MAEEMTKAEDMLRNPDDVWKNKAVSKLIGKWLKTAPKKQRELLATAVGVKNFKKAEPSPRMKMFNERSRRLSGLGGGLKVEPKSLSLEVSGQSMQDLAQKKEPVVQQQDQQPKKSKDESLFITTNAAFQGAVEGENFQEILSWARPEPTENLTFRSQWGDALSDRGGKGDWFGKYYRSQYQVYNEEVHGPKPDQSTRNSKEFFSWIKRQQLYYNDILNPEVTEKVDEWMSTAPPEEKRSLLNLFANLHTVIQPVRQYNSTTKADHTRFRPSSARPMTYNMDKAKKTKPKTRPKSAPVRSKTKAASSATNTGVGSSIKDPRASFEEDLFGKENVSAKKAFKDKGDKKKELYKSSIPIAWSSVPTTTNESAYREMCKSATAAGHQSAKGHNYISDFTCPFGTVNMHAKAKKTREQNRFLVPASFLSTKTQRARSGAGKGSTTNRMTYMARSEEENRQQNKMAARMVAESKKARYKSLVPLGNKGITDLVVWKSTNKELFRDTKAQLTWQKESLKKAANSIQKAFNGPTACVGVTAPCNKRPTKWVY
ncbi:hypothetical protein HKI87_01g04540 [Chloropicon roscoffensis]|uniref:Uncharacterized protein n=1 Tax=Chloropicon roscoffensis TaxID=1461544 RepID=A0AAX4NZ95_9CHLO